MTIALWAAAACGGIAFITHFGSIAMALVRCRKPRGHRRPPADAPPVTIIRPVCGVDEFSETTLRSTFELDYPHCQILFCVASARDPVVPLVNALIAANPGASAQLLIGNEKISENPKLNNIVKGWRAAANDRVVVVDSNLLMTADYVQRLLATWRSDTGMISAPPIGSHPRGFWAEIECAFLNAYQARWQYAADTLGFGFAQGKTLFFRRHDIEAAGGLRALAAEAAEDAACTKLMRAAGRRVRLVDAPFQQPLGTRARDDVWSRQVRWARLRRDSFPALYAIEIVSGSILPLVCTLWLAFAAGYSTIVALVAFLALWYGAEILLAAVAGWRLPLLYPLHAILRDALLPLLWFEGWRGRGFEWRGNLMSIGESSQSPN
jgi:ceramide glucosyltransferase